MGSMLNRRQMLGGLAGLAGAVIAGPVLGGEPKEPTIIYLTPNGPEVLSYETTVMRKLPAGSLEELLKKGKTELPKKRVANVKLSRKPSVLYPVTTSIKRVEDGYDVSVDSIGHGSVHILNSNGFFLTNHHVVEDHLNGKGNYFLLYDPETRIIRQANILAHNKGWDLALGKIEIPKELRGHYNGINIANRVPERTEAVLSIVFEDHLYVDGKVFDDVMKHIKVSMGRNGLVFQQTSIVPEDDNLTYSIPFGRVLGKGEYDKLLNEKGFSGIQKGQHVYLSTRMLRGDRKGNTIYSSTDETEGDKRFANIVSPGNSGSGGYGSNGELLCIIRGVCEVRAGVKKGDVDLGSGFPYVFVGPKAIRSFLGDYVEGVKR